MQADRGNFGQRLKLERERRGIDLKDIAESTKIKESLFADLERGDFSKWPQGIFRRAHLCAYASAIGLPSQPLVTEFMLFFQEDGATEASTPHDLGKTSPTPASPQQRRPTTPAARTSGAWRAWVIAFDVSAVCLVSALSAALTGVGVWSVTGLVGLAYFSVSSGCVGRSFGKCAQDWIHTIVQTRSYSPQAVPAPLAEVPLVAPPRLPSPVVEIDEIEPEPEVYDQRVSA